MKQKDYTGLLALEGARVFASRKDLPFKRLLPTTAAGGLLGWGALAVSKCLA